MVVCRPSSVDEWNKTFPSPTSSLKRLMALMKQPAQQKSEDETYLPQQVLVTCHTRDREDAVFSILLF